MIIKGVVSAVDTNNKTVDVILPEYDNVVTRPFKCYREGLIETLKINDFVLVVVFNNDLNDCMII